MIAITKVLFEYRGGSVTDEVPVQQTVPVGAALAPVPQAIRKVIVPQTAYQQNLRQAFNTLPNQGRNLQLAGQGLPANPVHQAEFDTKFKQVAAANRNLNVAGVPVSQVQKVATPVPQEVSGIDAAKIALTKGAKATGEAISSGAETAGKAVASGAKSAAEHVAEHPVAAPLTLAAGVASTLGLRKLLSRNKQV